MTSLAKQLQRLVVPHTQTVFGGDTRKTSLLFNPVDAAALDRETYFALGVSGLEELEGIDPSFEKFHRSLFSEASQMFERSVQTKEINEKLDKTICTFLLRLSPYFLLRPAHKALEWLIYRYHIQFYNVDDLMMCILPYHQSKMFVRAVQLINLDTHSASKWDWILPLQKSGVHLTKSVLVNHCRTNSAFLAFVCNMVPKFIEAHADVEDVNKVELRVLFSFYATTVLGVLESGKITETRVAALFESLVRGFKSQIVDYKAASYIILANLIQKTHLKTELIETFVNIICKYTSPALQTESVTCLLLIYQKQDIKTMRKKAFKYLSQQTNLVVVLSGLSEKYDIHYLVSPFLTRLIPAAFKQTLLNIVSSDSSENDDDIPPPQLIHLLQDLLTMLPLNDSTADFVASEVLDQYLMYVFNHDFDEGDLLVQTIQQVVRQMEGRYPIAVDKAVDKILKLCADEEKKAAVMSFLNVSAFSNDHHVVTTNVKSLVLSLNHHQAAVRQSAVEFLLSHTDKFEEKFVSEAILARLRDDDLNVVTAVVKNCQNLSEVVENKEELEVCLLQLLQRCDGKEKRKEICTTAVKNICTNNNSSFRVAFSYLPLLSGSESEVAVCQSLLKHSQTDVIQRASEACLNQLTLMFTGEEEVTEENIAEFNMFVSQRIAETLTYSNIQHIVEDLSGVQVGRKRDVVMLEFTLTTLYYMIDRCSQHSDIVQLCCLQSQLLSLIHSKKMISRVHMKKTVSDLKHVVMVMNKEIQKNKMKVLYPCFLFYLQHAVTQTSVPDSLQTATFWQYGGSKETGDVWLLTVVSMFGFVVDQAVDTFSSGHSHAKNVIGIMIKHLFSTTELFVKFLGLMWTRHVNNQTGHLPLTTSLQAMALKLGQTVFEKSDHKQTTDFINNPAPVLCSLLIACTCVCQPMRQVAVECLKVILSNSDVSATFHPLVVHIVKCEQEILSDSSFVSQVIASTLSFDIESDSGLQSPKQKRRRSQHQSSKSVMLSNFLDIALDSRTPAFVANSVIGLTQHINTTESFMQLLPLIEQYSEKLFSQELSVCEAGSLEILLHKYTPQITRCLQENSPGLKALTWAMKCDKNLENKTTVQKTVLPLITPEFYNTLPTSDCRRQILSCLFDVIMETENPDVTAIVKKVIKHLTLNTVHVISELNVVLSLSSPTTVRESKKKRQTYPQEEVSEFDSPCWQRVVIVLEAVQDKKKLENPELLIPVCFQIMSRVLELDEHLTAEYTKQLLLTLLYNVCNSLSTDNKQMKIPSEQFNMELIVQCIRTSDNPQTHHQALLLLTVAAHICPELLLHNIMSVFTFMGTNILRQDDSYSFHVISRILETVIPALAAACEARAKLSSEVSSTDVVMTSVLRVFASALPHIPEHRKVVIFTKLVSVVGEKHFLWQFLLLVLEHHITSAVEKKRDEESDVTERKESSPVSAQILNFLTQLATSFTPAMVLYTAKSAIAYIGSLPEDKPSDAVLRQRTTAKQLQAVSKDDVEIFSYTFHTAKQMRHFKYCVIHLFIHLFSSKQFIAQVSVADEASLLKNFQKFLSELLQYIATSSKLADKHNNSPMSKYWRALLHKTYELLDKVVSLLPDPIFLNVVSGLLDHTLSTVQCKAMELLTNKLQHMKLQTTDKQLLPVVDQLMSIVKTMMRKSDEEATKSGTVALYTLNVLCRLLGESNPDLFIQVLTHTTKVLRVCKDNNVLACALLCIAEICSSLKVHVIQHLNTFMPKVLKIMNSEQLIRNDLLQMGAVTAVHRIVESLPHFISPYLLEITKQVTCNLVNEGGITQKTQVQQRVQSIRYILATIVSTRVLLPNIISCYESAAENMQVCVPSVLSLLEEHIRSMNKEDLSSFHSQLLSFFFSALSFRELHPEAKQSVITVIESAVIDTMITMVMKMSEATFRPMLFKIFDWATRQDGSRDRVLVFYQLADRLAGKLRSLFTLFAGHIIKHAAQTLDNNNIAKTDVKYFGSGKSAQRKSCLLLNLVLDCLHKCFLYDSEGFVNKERFDSLMQHLVDQIENTLYHFEERISQHLVPCIAQFAVAVQDDSLWRSLNYQILLKTRNPDHRVRLAALDVVDAFNKKLGDDFMSLLPETVPFLAELMEDDNEEVETRCQAVISDMEKTLGESLQKYF